MINKNNNNLKFRCKYATKKTVIMATRMFKRNILKKY